MNRPYIVCHMISSVDGRIDCAMVDKISGDEYYAALKQLDCPSTLTGRVTMEHYSAEKEPFRPSHPETAGKASFHKAIEAEAYTVAIDTRGKLRWPSAEIDGLPLLCITSENATLEYLDRLREQGVSYVCVGNGCIDLPKAMEMLHEHFGIERLAIVGGGHINGAFLAAGLIDEFSMMVAPGIDGREGQTAVFDGIADLNRQPAALRLESCQRFENGTVWLRYTPVR